MSGTVYLLCFDQPYRWCRHYLGWCNGGEEALERRLREHASGRGARLMQVISEAGIGFTLVRTWEGSRQDERALKDRKNACEFCPNCRREYLEKRRRRERERQAMKKEMLLV